MDTQPFIVAFPPGQLSPADRERLDEAGIITVEAEDPEAIRQIQLAAPLMTTCLDGDDLLRAALSAIAGQKAESSAGMITAAGRAAHEFVRMLAHSAAQQSGQGAGSQS